MCETIENRQSDNKTQVKIIIMGVDSRKPFDVANIMQNRYGFDCILCSSKNNRLLRIVFGQQVHLLRSHSYHVFVEDFKSILLAYKGYEFVYLPCAVKPTQWFYKYVAAHPFSKLHFLLPDNDTFDIVRDKKKFQSYCENNHFPIPKSYGKEDIEKLRSDFFPLLLKPTIGEGSVGIRFINEKEDISSLEEVDFNRYVLQKKVNSSQKVIGAFFLCVKGQVVNAYTHHRIRTFPTKGGVTVYSRSSFVKEIIEIGSQLLEDLHYEGLAMIEFMYDDISQKWFIIELNPRIWGSILLSSFNNAHFLKDYVRLCLGVNEEELEHKSIKKDVYIRWVFPFDFLNLLKGDISFSDFFAFNKKDTCYINFTYSSKIRAILYLLYFTFNKESFKRFFQKIF